MSDRRHTRRLIEALTEPGFRFHGRVTLRFRAKPIVPRVGTDGVTTISERGLLPGFLPFMLSILCAAVAISDLLAQASMPAPRSLIAILTDFVTLGTRACLFSTLAFGLACIGVLFSLGRRYVAIASDESMVTIGSWRHFARRYRTLDPDAWRSIASVRIVEAPTRTHLFQNTRRHFVVICCPHDMGTGDVVTFAESGTRERAVAHAHLLSSLLLDIPIDASPADVIHNSAIPLWPPFI